MRYARGVARVLFAAVLFIGGLLGLFLWGFNQPLELPSPSGPFNVGRVTYAAGEARGLPLVVWYPIDKSSPATPAPYNPTIAGRLLDGQPDAMEQNLASVQD